MRQKFTSEHRTDENYNPAGGTTFGTGFTIEWQDGPLGRGEDRKEPNGAFVEGVILACVDRLNFYQASRFVCSSNAVAIRHLEAALEELDKRTSDRERRGVEGMHER